MFSFVPLVLWSFRAYSNSRKAQLKAADKRIHLVAEVVEAIRAVKIYGYESCFQDRALIYRNQELKYLKQSIWHRILMVLTINAGPIGATVLTFMSYSLTGHKLKPATIFPALQLFNTLQDPMKRLPMSMVTLLDALIASRRIRDILVAEDLTTTLVIDPQASYAISVKGEFTFESVAPPDIQADLMATQSRNQRKAQGWTRIAAKHDSKLEFNEECVQAQPFHLKGIQLDIGPGDLVCITGRVGSGKSALLQALIGQMRPNPGK